MPSMPNFFSVLKTALVSFVTAVISLFSSAPAIDTAPPLPVATSTNVVAVEIPAPSDAAEIVLQPKPATEQSSPTPVKPTSEIEEPSSVVPPPAPVAPVLPWDTVNKLARAATVNILCTSVAGGPFNPVSGSGVLIDPRGIILVNAHLAQYLLLKDYPVKDSLSCIVRLGSPAVPRYFAELVYISPAWVQDHYKEILLPDPLGTGENDFSFLYIGNPTDPLSERPALFPHLPLSLVETSEVIGHPVIITAYPAGFLGGINIQTNLFLSSAAAEIQDVYTFLEQTVDLFSLGGTVVSQQGSSGGAVVNAEGRLTGIVVTSSDAPTTADRDLRAITLSHVNRALQKERGISLHEFLLQNPDEAVAQFSRDVSPALTSLFVSKLNAALAD